MQKTVYQKPELRDANDNIIQEGAFGKNTALSNSTNDGWIDYVMNNLEALHDVVGETSPTLDANGHVVEPANLAIGDEDGNRIKDSYLKLSGGKVTGIASFRTDLRMLDNQDNRWGGLYVPGTTASEQYLSLYGGTRATGDARLNLYSVGNGKFELTGYSTDGANAYTLTHDNSGNLNWRGYPLAWKKDYLPLTGGTMSGQIIFGHTGYYIRRSVDDSYISMFGGTSATGGANFYLFGKDESRAGQFWLTAWNGTTQGKLVGEANGTLTWNGREVERVNASGTNYIRFESGLQICWGDKATTANTTSDTVTFPVAFSSSSSFFASANPQTTSNTYICNAGNFSSTGMTLYHTSTSSINIKWLTIGKWK